MLVKVECKGNWKWIRIPVKNDCFDFCEFIKGVSAKFNLPRGANVALKDSAGVEVDGDIFDELVRTFMSSFKIVVGDPAGNVPQAVTDLSEPSCPEFSSVKSESSDFTVIPPSSKSYKKRVLEKPSDCIVSKKLVQAALQSKPGVPDILKEYEQTNSLSDKTRKKLVNIIVADMVEKYGKIPPVNIRVSYALGIITLFPNLKDRCSPTGYEQYYDRRRGQGYIAYRLKTVQRNLLINLRRASKVVYQNGPKTMREIFSTIEQLSVHECTQAVSTMKHSTDTLFIKNKMMTTLKYRLNLIHGPYKSSLVFDYFPRFLDTPGLIHQDFTMLFGDDISSKFIAKWPTFYKPRIIADCKILRHGAHVDNLLSALDESDCGWDSEMAAILLLLHLLPPTVKGRKTGRISVIEATDRVVKFMKVGTSIKTFLERAASTQPFLLCVGETRNRIQRFYIILNQKAIPCMMQTAIAAFDELFKAHFVFAVSYDDSLSNFYTFIQTTVYGIDVGYTKESPRVKEIRVRFHNTEV